MEMFSIISLSLTSAIIVVFLKQYRSDLAVVLSLAAGAIILLAIISKAVPLFNTVSNIIKSAGVEPQYVSVMLKSLGICYLTQFSSDVCNDFGQSSLGSKIELCGKIMLALISLPMLVSLISTITKMIG